MFGFHKDRNVCSLAITQVLTFFRCRVGLGDQPSQASPPFSWHTSSWNNFRLLLLFAAAC